MMSTKRPVFQLNLEESETKRKYFHIYTEQRKEAYAESLGLTHCARPPVDTLISKLMLYLQTLPLSAPTEQGRIFWASSAGEAWMGMHWLIKKEWLDSYEFPNFLEETEKNTRNKKEIAKAKATIVKAQNDTELLGDVFKALLHLCEKSSTVAHFGKYPEYIGGARLFSEIVVEIAHHGGLINLLPLVYKSDAHSKTSKEELVRSVLGIVARIEDKDSNIYPDNTQLFIGKLIDHAIKRAGDNDSYRKEVFTNFTSALRSYISQANSTNCGLVTLRESKKDGQNWEISKGKSAGFQRLPPVPLAPRGLQRSVARCSERLDICNY